MASKLFRKDGLAWVLRYLVACWKADPSIRPYLPRQENAPPYLYDFHVHTRASDGSATHEEVLRHAGATGTIDGLAFTDHVKFADLYNGKRSVPSARPLAASFKGREVANRFVEKGVLPPHFKTFPGSAEFCIPLDPAHEKWSVELIGVGLPESFIRDCGGLQRMSRWHAMELIEAIHGANGLVIAPHPFFFVPTGTNPELLRRVDAVEALNHTTGIWFDGALDDVIRRLPHGEILLPLKVLFGYPNWAAGVLSGRMDVARTGSSDAHLLGFVGSAVTGVHEPILSLEDLRTAFKSRATVPLLNPRWELQADHEAIKAEFLRKWWQPYRDIVVRLARRHPALRKIVKVALYPLRLIDERRSGE
ncbi:MAG: PHP-associated domain-containing protein [Promethearchaeota archaeon]